MFFIWNSGKFPSILKLRFSSLKNPDIFAGFFKIKGSSRTSDKWLLFWISKLKVKLFCATCLEVGGWMSEGSADANIRVKESFSVLKEYRPDILPDIKSDSMLTDWGVCSLWASIWKFRVENIFPLLLKERVSIDKTPSALSRLFPSKLALRMNPKVEFEYWGANCSSCKRIFSPRATNCNIGRLSNRSIVPFICKFPFGSSILRVPSYFEPL